MLATGSLKLISDKHFAATRREQDEFQPCYIFPAFISATRFSKAAVLALSALPLAIAASATVRASSFLPAPQRIFALAERLGNVSLTLMDWSINFSASSKFLSR